MFNRFWSNAPFKDGLVNFLVILLVVAIGFMFMVIFEPGLFKSIDEEVLTVKVVGVSDGDIITVLASNHARIRVRLTGIDAPDRNQDFGMRARKNLADKVFGKTVELHIRGKDNLKQTLGLVLLDDKDINESMVEDGYAWFYRKYADQIPKDESTRYDEAETAAKSKKLGLWAAQNPVAPWDFRKDK